MTRPAIARPVGIRSIRPGGEAARLVMAGLLCLALFGAAVPERCRAGEREDAAQVRDAFGRLWRPGPPPQRIVSLSPNLTEILFALGVSKARIVGVTRYCDVPAEARELPRVGGIVDPSVEAILAAKPDLVLATRGNPRIVLDRLRDAGLRVLALESQGGLESIERMMEQISAIVTSDRPAQADSVIAAFHDRRACLASVSSGIAVDERPSVYYFDPVSPDWTAGPGTHVSEAIAFAGGRNVADDAPVAWPRYSLEALIAEQPDWILIAAPGDSTSRDGETALVKDLAARPGFKSLRALREGRVCVVAGDALMRPGPRILGAVEILARRLHPDLDWGCAR